MVECSKGNIDLNIDNYDYMGECDHKIYFKDALNVKSLKEESIDLVVTSPPYWSIKDYGNENQLGFSDNLNEYIEKLTKIFSYCIKALKPGSKLCINIGDQFLRNDAKKKQVYQIIPLSAMIINNILAKHQEEVVYLGTINWNKVTRSKTSGGGQIMGSYPYPKSGYFFVNREFIIIFRKLGAIKKKHRPEPYLKFASKITLEEWRLYFKDTWKFPPADQKTHMAMFPEELPKRLIKMYSFVGDVVLDPFMGSGTTNKMAASLGRSSIGYEIGFETKDGSEWKNLIKNKIENPGTLINFEEVIKEDGNKRTFPSNIFMKNNYKYY